MNQPISYSSQPARRMSTDRIADVIGHLVSSLDSYRREVRLYPQGHPKLETRMRDLIGTLAGFLEAKSEGLTLQLRHDGLYSRNELIPGVEAQLVAFRALLRERMVELVHFKTGIDENDIECFVRFLMEEAHELKRVGERRDSLSANLDIYYFDESFALADRAVSEEEILENWDKDRFLESDPLKDIDKWGDFRTSQLEMISRVMQGSTVSNRIERLQGLPGATGKGRDFVHSFFDILRNDPNTDWEDEEALTKIIDNALVMLDEAKESIDASDALPSRLLTPGNSDADERFTHLYWRMMQNFFPGVHEERSPRQAEDLAFQGDQKSAIDDGTGIDSKGSWELTEVPEEDWGRTDPMELQDEILQNLEPEILFQNFSTTVIQLLGVDPEANSRETMTTFGEVFCRLCGEERDGWKLLETSLEELEDTAADVALSWRRNLLVSHLPPEVVLETISKPHNIDIDELIAQPPALNSELKESKSSPLRQARETLRTLLSRRDKHAFTILHHIVREHGEVLGEWHSVLREVCSNADVACDWLDENAATISDPRSVPFLLQLPIQDCRFILMTHLERMPAKEVQRLFNACAARASTEATTFILLGLEINEPLTRQAAIRAFGRCRDQSSVRILETLLTDQNLGEHSNAEVEVICQALASHPLLEGLDFLKKVVKSRKSMLFHTWKNGIRSAAKSALAGRK